MVTSKRQPKKGKKAMFNYVYLHSLVKVILFLVFPGGVPGLASCQPSGEPNDSFDPIRIRAKSTLCSLRACIRQLKRARLPMPNPLCQAAMPGDVPDSPVVTGKHGIVEGTLCRVSGDSTDFKLHSSTDRIFYM